MCQRCNHGNVAMLQQERCCTPAMLTVRPVLPCACGGLQPYAARRMLTTGPLRRALFSVRAQCNTHTLRTGPLRRALFSARALCKGGRANATHAIAIAIAADCGRFGCRAAQEGSLRKSSNFLMVPAVRCCLSASGSVELVSPPPRNGPGATSRPAGVQKECWPSTKPGPNRMPVAPHVRRTGTFARTACRPAPVP